MTFSDIFIMILWWLWWCECAQCQNRHTFRYECLWNVDLWL